MNTPPKVGYQEPREDVARPFKARAYNDGYYSKYNSPNFMATPTAGPATSPMKSAAQKNLERSEDPTVGARSAVSSRDARLNPHRAAYGVGSWTGESYLAPGGGTMVTPAKPPPRVVPQSLAHAAYGAGMYVPQDSLEHPDCSGFTKLQQRHLPSPSQLTPKPSGCRGDIDICHNGHKSFNAPPAPAYGSGVYAQKVAQEAQGVAGVHYGSRQGGVSDAKYLPGSHAEATMGRNATVPDYGSGNFASPRQIMPHDRYAVGHPASRNPGHGAFFTPRSGIY